MSISVTALLNKIETTPELVEFDEVMAVIEEHYHFTPAGFANGLGDERVVNAAGSNEGSCKIFAFARLHQLSPAQTLACFGRYYRDDVLNHPQGSDHANIRAFMNHGWAGVEFDQLPLIPR